LRAIKDGIAPDDRVIVNGLARVRPGQMVNAQEQAEPGKPAAPASPTKTN